MIRAIIADDEPLSRRVVQQLAARHADLTIVAECGDGAAASEAIAELRPDLVFLDVRMPLASGIDVAHAQRTSDRIERAPLVVFVTAYDQFALPAFDVAAVDYLLKPVVEARFDAALDRVRERLLHGVANTKPAHLTARVGARDVIIPLGAVEYIEADDVYAAVHANGKRYLVRAPLESLERTLDAAVFCRIHRSYIVRRDRVQEARRANGVTELKVAGTWLPVSRRRRRAVESLLEPLAT